MRGCFCGGMTGLALDLVRRLTQQTKIIHLFLSLFVCYLILVYSKRTYKLIRYGILYGKSSFLFAVLKKVGIIKMISASMQLCAQCSMLAIVNDNFKWKSVKKNLKKSGKKNLYTQIMEYLKNLYGILREGN